MASDKVRFEHLLSSFDSRKTPDMLVFFLSLVLLGWNVGWASICWCWTRFYGTRDLRTIFSFVFPQLCLDFSYWELRPVRWGLSGHFCSFKVITFTVQKFHVLWEFDPCFLCHRVDIFRLRATGLDLGEVENSVGWIETNPQSWVGNPQWLVEPFWWDIEHYSQIVFWNSEISHSRAWTRYTRSTFQKFWWFDENI